MDPRMHVFHGNEFKLLSGDIMDQEKQGPGTSIRNIIWAVDPFVADETLQRSASELLSSLTESGNAIIYPIYVWGIYPTDIHFNLPPKFEEQMRKKAQTRLKTIVTRSKIRRVRPLTVLAG